MLKNVSFKTKIFFLVTAVVVVSFLALNLTVYTRNIKMVEKDAYSLVEEIAEKYKNEIMAELQGARVTSGTLVTVLETLKDYNIDDRDLINDILKNALVKKEYITAFCIAYEPENGDTGRFTPCWNKLDGNIEHESFYDRGPSDWYIVPRLTNHEYVTDPYPYRLQGQDVMLASFIFPIIHRGKFSGVISSDIVLDNLQEMVSRVNTRRNGEYTAIFSSSGIIAAHPQKEYLGKDLSEVLTDDTANIKGAIKKGKLYVSGSKDFYTVYMPIRFSASSSPWSVAVSFPIAGVLQPARDIRNYTIVASVISTCVIAVLLYLILKSISRPILTLANTAKIIGEGNFHAEIPVSQNNDEIGVLSTAFKVMTENLIAAKEQAECSSRAKGDFLSNMSHEMRTPMNVIIGMTNIGKSASAADKKDCAFKKIEDASTHLLGVINDVLDMAKIEANKMELSSIDFDFEKTIQRVVSMINFKVDEKHQKLHISMDNSIPNSLIGDDLRLSQVITNLLSNAVKFTPDNGTIRLNSRFIGEANGVCTIQFEVADSGVGISPEQQARLFNSFQQADSGTSRKFGGTGLGLVISKRIIEMMGGEIHIESVVGRGASFIFTVKLERGKAEQHALPLSGADTNTPAAAATFPGRRVLLAEDIEINREIVLFLLEPMELKIDCARNGLEALYLFRENQERYDLIFMYMQMPKMDGLEATRCIRTMEEKCDAGSGVPDKKIRAIRRRRIPIIAMTANVFREDIEKCLAAGMDDHVGKPLNGDEVLEKLRKYLPEDGEKNTASAISHLQERLQDHCGLYPSSCRNVQASCPKIA